MAEGPDRWSSPQWLAEARSWLEDSLSRQGITTTGPLVRHHVRFWSTVLHVETDAGRVWLKENASSQRFEAALLARVHRRAPGRVAEPLAVDQESGLFATADIGESMWGEAPPREHLVRLVREFAMLQRALVPHEEEVLGSGLPVFPVGAEELMTWVASVREELRELPVDDPRRLTSEEDDLLDAGLPRLGEAAGLLAASGVPSSLQHNDLHLGNAFRSPGDRFAFIDLGDAVWAHPMAVLRIPLWDVRAGAASGHPADTGGVLAAWQDVWCDVITLDAAARLLPAADRISCLHRAESWRRLQRDVPVDAIDERFRRSVPQWLVDAAAPDPFRSASGR